MSKIKELWQYAMFRWCIYQALLVVFGLLLKNGALSSRIPYTNQYGYRRRSQQTYHLFEVDFGDIAILIWILIFTLPAVWVWRKPIWKAIGFLNQKAEVD